MFNWLKKRQKQRVKEIADEVEKRLTDRSAYDRFLPPVVLRDTVYMLTEGGSVYAMRYDHINEMEQIITIIRR